MRAKVAFAALFLVACVLSNPVSAQDSRLWKPTKGDGAEVTRLAFEPAEDWLRRNQYQNPAADAERRKFEDYIASQRERAQAFAPERRDKLFEEFLRWRETRDGQ